MKRNFLVIYLVAATSLSALPQAALCQPSTSSSEQHGEKPMLLQQSAIVYKAPEEGGPRRLQVVANDVNDVHLYSAASLESERISVLAGSSVLANLGCVAGEKRVWCQLKPLQRGASTGYVPGEFLVPARGPDGVIPMGPDTSKKRARKGDFDASTQVACAQEVGQVLGSCSAQVARGGGGDAALVVKFNNGFARTLYFVHGMFTSANATMSGVGTDTDWKTTDGLYSIRVDDQRYEIAEAFVLGKRLKEDNTEK